MPLHPDPSDPGYAQALPELPRITTKQRANADDDPDYDPTAGDDDGPSPRKRATPPSRARAAQNSGGALQASKRAKKRSFMPFDMPLDSSQAFLQKPDGTAAGPMPMLHINADMIAAVPSSGMAAGTGAAGLPAGPQVRQQQIEQKEEAMVAPDVSMDMDASQGQDGSGSGKVTPRRQRSRFRGVFLQRCAFSRSRQDQDFSKLHHNSHLPFSIV
jgi:hypothetical protein